MSHAADSRRLTMSRVGHIIMVMSKPEGGRGRKGSSGRDAHDYLAAADFKARCLTLMNRVRETGVEYVITKHGRPVARLVPYTEPGKRSLFGALKGTVLKYERPFDPIDADYDIDDDIDRP